MSRVTQNEIRPNPAEKFLTWKTLKKDVEVDGETLTKIDKGTFTIYDKDTEENIAVPTPFVFALINGDNVTFKGYDEKKKIGYYSNEVELPEHEVVIKSKEGKALSFSLKDYKANKTALQGMGIKYTKPVYVGVENEDGDIELQCLVLSGAPLTGGNDINNKNPDDAADGWFGFSKVNRKKLYTHWIIVKEYKIKKKGENKYTIPVFSIGDEITPEEGKSLDALDMELKEYFKYYFAKPAAEDKKEAQEEIPAGADGEDDLAF